jgi:hypothetical protein
MAFRHELLRPNGPWKRCGTSCFKLNGYLAIHTFCPVSNNVFPMRRKYSRRGRENRKRFFTVLAGFFLAQAKPY